MAKTGSTLHLGIDKLFKKIFTPSPLAPPEQLQNKFHAIYKKVKNLEWIEYQNDWEAIFIKDGEEYIIRMNLEGSVLDQKVNLPLQKVPQAVLECTRQHGEVMNIIQATSGDLHKYEIIMRDHDLNRFLLLISETGELLHRSSL